jgi:hypothetical protein
MSSLLCEHAAHNYHSQIIPFPVSISHVYFCFFAHLVSDLWSEQTWIRFKVIVERYSFGKLWHLANVPLQSKRAMGKISSPPFLTFFDRSKIEWAIAYLLRDVAHALCLAQLYCCSWLVDVAHAVCSVQQYNPHELHLPTTGLETPTIPVPSQMLQRLENLHQLLESHLEPL